MIAFNIMCCLGAMYYAVELARVICEVIKDEKRWKEAKRRK